MPSRRKIKIEKVSNPRELGAITRKLSIQIKRLAESETAENMKSNAFESTDAALIEVEKWQQEIYDHLKKINHLEVLEESDRVFNMKEAYFPLGTCSASPFLTTLITIGASGTTAPVTLFFPNNELPPQNLFADETNTANISELPTDYPPNDKLLGYMQLTFHPWLIFKQKTFPVIVFIDINPVHISWEFLSFCKEKEIILLRTTSALNLHPISSFVVPHLENAWISALLEWSSTHENQEIGMESIPPIFGEVFKKTITIELLADAFRKCGTFPFDPVTVYKQGMTRSTSLQDVNSIPRTLHSETQPIDEDLNQPTTEISQQEVISETASSNGETPIQQNIAPAQTVHPAQRHAQITHTNEPTAQFRILLGPLTYEFMHAGNSWAGAIENTSLFHVWKRLQELHHHFIHPTPQTDHLRANKINQQFRMEFERLIGPLLYEFNKSGDVWTGATENRGLFEVWKQLCIILDG